MKYYLLPLLLSSLAWSVVSIKPVEIQKRQAITFEQGIAFSSHSGNVEKMNFKLATSLKQYGGSFVNTLALAYDYGESRGTKDTNALFLHLRHIHDTNWQEVNAELFTQLEKDDFKDITSKTLLGSNLRYKIDTDGLDVFVGFGVFYTWLDEVGVEDNYTSINSYLSLSYTLNKSTSLTYKGYYQPRIGDFEDYQLYQTAQLSVEISERISFFVNVLHEYNAQPSEGIERSDFAQTTGLSYKF